MLDRPLVFLDLETTGATAARDRITEIGLIALEHGEYSGEWSTLVNPEVDIPPFIESLTGITNDMVAQAPTFAAVARELGAWLAGRVLVAHNARFDYGFLKSEFQRIDVEYRSEVVCTVKLSRSLFPGHARHNLDSLMQRHGVSCGARHRALGDARVLWDLAQKWRDEVGAAALAAAAAAQINAARLRPELARFALDEIPDTHGVYLFYGENDVPLYVGRGANLRARVLSHLAGARGSARDARIAQQLKRIDWKQTAGRLGSSIEEVRFKKELHPLLNQNSQGRAQRAIVDFKPEAWPFKGRIGVHEASGAFDAMYVFDEWRHLGTVRYDREISDDSFAALNDHPAFDPEIYRILKRHLSRPANAAEVIALQD